MKEARYKRLHIIWLFKWNILNRDIRRERKQIRVCQGLGVKGPDKWHGCLGQTGVAEWTVDGILIPAPDNALPILNRVPNTDKHKWKTWPGTRGWQGEGWPSDEQKEPQSHPTLKQGGQLGLWSPTSVPTVYFQDTGQILVQTVLLFT